MSRTNKKPDNQKAVKCPDCGMWLTTQGYGGHRRFYHGEYQKYLKKQLWDRLCVLRAADKISQPEFEMIAPNLSVGSKITMPEILEMKDLIDSYL